MLYGSLAVLAVLAALLVYRYDAYEKEPLWMLALVLLAGAGSMFVVGPIEDFTLDMFTSHPRKAAEIAFVAATHEELSRLIVVGLIALIFRSQFNDPMDGLIYGSMAGLGMATAESLFYLDLHQAPRDEIVPAAEVIRFCGHLIMGGITCFGLGMLRMGMRGWPVLLPLCAGYSMLLHFLWDWIAFTAAFRGEMTPWLTLGAIGIMLAGMIVYGMLVVVGSDWSRRIFAPHSNRQLWGWPVDVIISRSRKVRWRRRDDEG